MQCPQCRSYEVYRSRRHDRRIYRIFGVAKFRCHVCAHLFMRPILMHAMKYLLSEQYREHVYWNDLATGTHRSEYGHPKGQAELYKPHITSFQPRRHAFDKSKPVL